jgi:hypothetical protein
MNGAFMGLSIAGWHSSPPWHRVWSPISRLHDLGDEHENRFEAMRDTGSRPCGSFSGCFICFGTADQRSGGFPCASSGWHSRDRVHTLGLSSLLRMLLGSGPASAWLLAWRLLGWRLCGQRSRGQALGPPPSRSRSLGPRSPRPPGAWRPSGTRRSWWSWWSWRLALERLSTGWSHPVYKKSLQIQKLEHILVAQIEWI